MSCPPLGADVTHPSADQMGEKPSIAAMVASRDPGVSLYHCEVRLQYPNSRDKNMVKEVIEDTEAMFKRLLLKFYESTKQKKPEKIFYYRDGVSEGKKI
jgi:eukaryotic translation initiation factor 2C